MPGLVGLIGSLRKEDAISRLQLMLDAMNYESFYVTGFYSNEEFGLHVGWLVHPGSFSDCMPVESNDQRTALFFHGEVFTPKDRLDALRQKGYRFSDQNAGYLLSLYKESRERFFDQLNGSFVGVLLDSEQRRIRIFNDRLGYERLYHSTVPADGTFYFASEAKALLRVIPGAREFDRQGLAQLIRYGCTFAGTSLFRHVSLLPPAALWDFEARATARHTKTYFNESDWQEDASIRAETFEDSVGEIFRRTLPLYFESNLRPALSVTGGWDTRMILGCYQGQPGSLPCYTFAGISGDTVDLRQARKVAEAAGQAHEVLRLGPDFIADFESHADKTVYVSDGYGSVGLAHEIYLNQKARRISVLRLTGNFGSEVLREMTTFKEIPLAPEWLDGELRADFSESGERWKKLGSTDAARSAIFREIPWKIATTVRLASSQLTVRTPYLDTELLRISCICPSGISRDSIPGSVLRGQNPSLLQIPTDRGESVRGGWTGVVRQAWHKGTFKLDYLLSEQGPNWMPAAIDAAKLHRMMPMRHKYLDYRRWFNGALNGYVTESLTTRNGFARDLVGSKVISRILNDHQSGRENVLVDIQALLTLDIIARRLLGVSSSDEHVRERACLHT